METSGQQGTTRHTIAFFGLLSRTDVIVANDVESNRAALREARTTAQATALEHLKQYVAHRTTAFEAFNRIDPDSKATRDARERLEKARRDYEAFARSIGVVLESPDASPPAAPDS